MIAQARNVYVGSDKQYFASVLTPFTDHARSILYWPHMDTSGLLARLSRMVSQKTTMKVGVVARLFQRHP